MPLPIDGVDHCRGAVEILLAPRPAARKQFRSGEPCDRRCVFQRGVGFEAKRRTVVEHHVRGLGHSVCERIFIVDRHLEQRTGNVKFFLRQRARAAVRRFLGEITLHRNAERLGHAGGAADGDDRAAGFDEFFQLRELFFRATLRRATRGTRRELPSGFALARRRVRRAAGVFCESRRAVRENEHVELAAQIAGIERLRIDDVVLEVRTVRTASSSSRTAYCRRRCRRRQRESA